MSEKSRPPRLFGSRRRRPLRTAVRILGSVLLVAVVLLVGLWVTNPSPREAPSWSTGAAVPTARGEAAGAVLDTADGQRLAVVGGLHGLGRTSDAVTLYDPATNTWSATAPLPEPRHHASAAGIGSTLYVSGGSPSTTRVQQPTSDVWALDVESGGWVRLEPLPQPRWAHRMVAVDGRLYVVGGQPDAEVQIFEPGVGWTLGAPIPVVRDHLGVVGHDGEIWALGGRDEDGQLTGRVDIYDPAADTWRQGPDLPAPVSAAAVGVIDGRIHVVDGEDPATVGGGVLDAHWMLEPAVGTWEAGPPSRLPVHGAADGVIDGRLHVVGGASRQGLWSVLSWTREVQVLDPSR